MDTTSEDAGVSFDAGVSINEMDIRQGHLKYVLLRLELAGLTDQDQINLVRLVVAACQDKDVAESADSVRKAESASPLAIAIADIVSASLSNNTTAPSSQSVSSYRKAAALGAIFGAHASVGVWFGRELVDPVQAGLNAIKWAISGAVSACSIAALDERTQGFGTDEFLKPIPS